MRLVKTLLIGLFLIVVITFSIKNAGNVTVRYFGLIGTLEIPLFLVVLVAIFLGMFIGAMVDLLKRHRLKKAIQRAQRRMDELQGEIISVRKLMQSGPKNAARDT